MSAFNHAGRGSKQRVAVGFVQAPGVNGLCFVPFSVRLLSGALRLTMLFWGQSTSLCLGVHNAGEFVLWNIFSMGTM